MLQIEFEQTFKFVFLMKYCLVYGVHVTKHDFWLGDYFRIIGEI